MAINRSPAFQFYPGEYLDNKVLRMSDATQGRYIRLLCHMWKDSKDQCSIEDDDRSIARTLGITLKTWLKTREEIQRKNDRIFIEKNGFLISKRLRKEAKKQRKFRRMQSKKGESSAKSRGYGNV